MEKLKKTLLLSLSFAILSVYSLLAQSKDDNIIITNSTKNYSFERDKDRVSVKEKSETFYECTQKGTSLPVAEFYNDQIVLNKINGKKKGSEPQYRQYSSNDMFYTDMKICFFSLYFERKGSTAELKYEKTYKDPRYFTSIYFSELQFVKEKTITVTVPDWMGVELIERNFGDNIKKEVIRDERNKQAVYTYHITNEAAVKEESNARGRSYIYPHLQVACKYALLNGVKTTYFETLDDQYAWYHALVKEVNNDEAVIKAKAREIAGHCTSKEEKVKTLFAWVQDNIRYLAFEDGIAAFKPDEAQEVLRKKYGDCKGMSNLLKTLLVAEGFDARLCWLGTRHIAYDYSTPSLAADNHMICALFLDEKVYYLDPTVKYMPMGEYPQTIQNRQVLVEDKDPSRYLLNRIPRQAPEVNTDSLFCDYVIRDGVLQAQARQYYKGESKQLLLSLINATPKDKQEDALTSFLTNGKSQDKAEGVQLEGTSSQAAEVVISYTLNNKSGIQSLGEELYVDLDYSKDFRNNQVNIEKREHDLEFMYRHHIVCEAVLHLPEGYRVKHLPEALNVKKDAYIFQTSFRQEGNKILYKRQITLLTDYLPKSAFSEWNADLALLKKAYMEQIILSK